MLVMMLWLGLVSFSAAHHERHTGQNDEYCALCISQVSLGHALPTGTFSLYLQRIRPTFFL
ncbi:MAG: hypothetical protein ACI9Y1_002574 [Lentisphaeria bacterium]|jgi:hypothetical protein